MPQKAPFSEMQLRAALAQAGCWSDGLRSMGYEPTGHNIRTVQRWAGIWRISTVDPQVGTRLLPSGPGAAAAT